MLYLTENLKKYRTEKGLTQEDVAEALGITPQSVSRWERGECCPDILFLPALANLFEISVDMLIGMDVIRADETYYTIHQKANAAQHRGDYAAAAALYREALLVYPNRPDMMLGLAGALALGGKYADAIRWAEKGLVRSENEKQNATMRAALCFLYLRSGQLDKAHRAASRLPHARESREEILPLIAECRTPDLIDADLHRILLGEEK
ncbi:MAG: helix-turn-helix transcriptional regulator [Clostridia bacterium]|nr:helix-turn-helix transcriptional regulator [Clostridia bacterium]